MWLVHLIINFTILPSNIENMFLKIYFFNFFLDFFVCLQYQCCGIINQKDYDESKWKEQALGGDDLNYPLTCCVLNNPSDPQNYLNPMPKNKENCMNTSHQSKYRLDRYQPVSSSIHISYTTSSQK